VLAQTSIEAAAIGVSAVAVLRTGLGGPEERAHGALLPYGRAEATFGGVGPHGLVVVLAAVGLAFRGLAPVAAVGGLSLAAEPTVTALAETASTYLSTKSTTYLSTKSTTYLSTKPTAALSISTASLTESTATLSKASLTESTASTESTTAAMSEESSRVRLVIFLLRSRNCPSHQKSEHQCGLNHDVDGEIKLYFL